IWQARAQDGDDGDREKEEREGELYVDQLGDHGVRAAAKVSTEHPEGKSDRAAKEGRNYAHKERDACAEDDAAQNIAPELIGAEEMPGAARRHPRGGLQACPDIPPRPVLWAQLASQDPP